MKRLRHGLYAFGRVMLVVLVAVAFSSVQLYGQDTSTVVNDITNLNPVKVSKIISPRTTEEIINAVKEHHGPISIGGGRYSMGGQTATEQALQIDMRGFDSILCFSKVHREITVQAGITWRKIQEFIDPHDLSIKIMQTYANFTVGGSLSVNVHGRYIGQGPIILSVKQIEIVLANGDCIRASPKENEAVFYGAIGGYGGLGVITQATLMLTDNVKVERTDQVLSIQQYKQFFLDKIRDDTLVVFHNADIYPNSYKKIRAISYRKTSRDETVRHRLKPNNKGYGINRLVLSIVSGSSIGKWLRQHVIDPLFYIGKPVVWRNYEASYDVFSLEPTSREKSTYVLQEYFVPIDQFDSFYPLMAAILKKNNVNVLNISIRHAKKDPGSMLAWAQTDVFALVLYYRQGTKQEDKDEVKQWTQQLIDASISCEGTYYLPYQIHATPEQFLKAYPDSDRFFELKKQLDPTNKFRNKLWDAYYDFKKQTEELL